jgi:hypothetical protein
VLLAGLAQPLYACMVTEYVAPLAPILPLIVLVAAICLLFPWRAMPVLAVAGICAVETVWMLSAAPSVPPVLVEDVLAGRAGRLWVVPAAAAGGWAIVRLRRRGPVFPPGFRTNLHVLTRRPLVFIRKYRLPLAILLVGSVLDAITTMRFMLIYGVEEELHPAGRIIADVLGVGAGIAIGCAVRLGFVVVVAAIWRKWCGCLMVVCGVLYALAAASNHFGWMAWLWP